MSSQTEEANRGIPDFVGFHLRHYDVGEDIGIDIVGVFEKMLKLRKYVRRLNDIARDIDIAERESYLLEIKLDSPSRNLCYWQYRSEKLEKRMRRKTHDDPKFEKLKREYDELQKKIEKQNLELEELAKPIAKAKEEIEKLKEQARECKRKMDDITSLLCRPEVMQPKRLEICGSVRQNLERRQKEERQWLERKHQQELQWLNRMDESNGAEPSGSTPNESK